METCLRLQAPHVIVDAKNDNCFLAQEWWNPIWIHRVYRIRRSYIPELLGHIVREQQLRDAEPSSPGQDSFPGQDSKKNMKEVVFTFFGIDLQSLWRCKTAAVEDQESEFL